MTDSVETTDGALAAIERLLSGEQKQAPVETKTETPEPEPKPQAPQEPVADDEPEAPVTEPSAELEGGLVTKQSEPDKPLVAERKAPEATKTQPGADTTQQDALLAQLNSLIPALQHAIAGEFGDIKSDADLWRIATEDPQRYNRFVIHREQLRVAQARQQEIAVEQHGRWFQSEQQKLAKALPEIVDPVKGAALQNELRAFAQKQGYSPQQIAFASSQDVLTLHKAMQFEKWQASQKADAKKIAEDQAKAKEKAAKAPPVSKPGVATDERKTKAQERLQAFKKTGKPEELADWLQESGLA